MYIYLVIYLCSLYEEHGLLKSGMNN